MGREVLLGNVNAPAPAGRSRLRHRRDGARTCRPSVDADEFDTGIGLRVALLADTLRVDYAWGCSTEGRPCSSVSTRPSDRLPAAEGNRRTIGRSMTGLFSITYARLGSRIRPIEEDAEKELAAVRTGLLKSLFGSWRRGQAVAAGFIRGSSNREGAVEGCHRRTGKSRARPVRPLARPGRRPRRKTDKKKAQASARPGEDGGELARGPRPPRATHASRLCRSVGSRSPRRCPHGTWRRSGRPSRSARSMPPAIRDQRLRLRSSSRRRSRRSRSRSSARPALLAIHVLARADAATST